MCSSDAPAALAAAAAASALRDVVRAARLQRDRALRPSGHAQVKRVANSPRSMPCTAILARRSRPAARTPKVSTRRGAGTRRASSRRTHRRH